MKLLIGMVATILLLGAIGFGQTQSGVTGVVTDQSGAIVPGATVTLTDTKTGKELTTVTKDDGSYIFNVVEPGAGYRLTFSRQGFQTFVLNNVQVSVARTETQNAQLTPGEVSAKVEVVSTTGEATLNTTDPSIGNVIGTRQLQELPIQLRGSPASLLGLQPGVVGANVGTGSTNRVGSVTGSRADQGNITVDGIDANDVTTGQAFNTVANAPIDSIQEFTGTVAGLDAAAGRSSGGQIQLKTNSGTNRFHGNLREYYRTEKTAANAFFNNVNGITRPRLRRHQYGGSIGGPLPYPNFGENDGPMFRSGKDKLFFFFDDEMRRDRSQVTSSVVVPLQTFRDGKIAYVNNGPGCSSASRLSTQPQCISYLSPADIAAKDPRGIGINTALLNLYNSRYPLPNDLTGGDGRNTGLFRFNAPNTRDDKIYTLRFDAVPTDRQRLFVRTTITRRDSTNSTQFLPGDEDAVTFQDRSYAIAVGHTWIITPNLTNVITAGLSKSQNIFSPPQGGKQPSFPNSFGGGTVAFPFASNSFQDRHVSVPTYRDDISWTHGSHTFLGGVSYKPIRQLSSLILDFNFATIGLGGNTPALSTAQRPADIFQGNGALTTYDTAFTTLLGRIAAVSTNFNYDASGKVLPPGTGKTRNYAYNEYEGYFQDNWKIRNDLTLNLGVRYTLYPAPYETNGALASDTTDWRALFAKRLANAAAGISGDSAEPFLVYNLAGKTNNAPPLYQTDKNNWAPRLGFNYNPSFKDGLLGKLFGERKTSIRGSYDLTYDRVSGAILFIQNQSDYVFQNSAALNFGNINSNIGLLTDPRFVSPGTLPIVPTAPAITKPLTPFVTNGVPFGEAEGDTNYTVDHNFKTPYSHLFSFGIQRELPGNHVLDVSYVGRLGRSLFVQSDVAQVTNFKDPTSGQLLFNAFNSLQASNLACAALAANQQAACRANIAPIPFFENLVTAAIHANFGPQFGCGSFGLGSNCAQLVGNPSFTGNLINIGDTSDTIQALNSNGLLANNIGLSGQFATNAYVTNQGTSSYNGLLISLRKRFSKGYEYGLNYTFSKSLDNNSSVANTVFGGLVCDVNDPDICKGPSDFDIRHIFNANFIAQLPFGRGRWLGHDMNRFVDAFLGGWNLSGILNARSGLPVSAGPSASAFPLSFVVGSPAIITDLSKFKINIHQTPQGLQFFDDPVAANAALRDPHHGELGSRNLLRSPGYWSLDMRLAKKITAPWSETQRFTLLVDAFNVTNTPQFASPNLNRNSSTFGIVTATQSTERQIQFGVRWDF